MRRTPLFALFLALPTALVFSQDAGMVLRTSVGYNTQRLSLPLNDDQKKQSEQFGQQAQTENRAGHFGDAMRAYHHGTAAMHSVEWTPQVELASSLQGKLDHAMLEPGRKVTISLTPLYSVDRAVAAPDKVKASIFLVAATRQGSAGSPAKSLAAAVAIDAAKLPFSEQVTLPDTAPGDYNLEVRLTLADGSSPEGLRQVFNKPLPIHVESLAADAAKLKARLDRDAKSTAPTLSTAQFVLARFNDCDNGVVSPAHYDFRGQFASANAILDAIEANKDPLAGKKGDMRRAYLSKVDQTLQPYRILIPAKYDGSPTPLVVALHGMGGDENSMFDGYHETLKVQAELHGFIVACPKGRENASMYRGPAEQDVLDVIAEVRRDYKIDPKRIYLMGHSMGGYGTWSVSIAHPELFAALGPISGGGNANAMDKIKDIPEYVTHGDDDRTVNVNMSRQMVAAGKKLNAPITYVEVPGGSHGGVAEPAFAPMFEFFAKQIKATPAP